MEEYSVDTSQTLTICLWYPLISVIGVRKPRPLSATSNTSFLYPQVAGFITHTTTTRMAQFIAILRGSIMM